MRTRSNAPGRTQRIAFAAAAVALALTPRVVGAVNEDREPWNGERVGGLASQLLSQAKLLETDLRATVAEAEAATPDPDREVGTGPRTVVLQDLAILETRGEAYRLALSNGQGREETRSLYGRIESLVRLAGSDMRQLPDYAKYRTRLEEMEGTVKQLGLFYAEHIEQQPPPDPLDRFK